jgi:hypothetical protein
MSTKYFIWIVRVSICLWEVSWKFLNFLSIFVTLNIFWVFPEFVLHWKIISKKI